jgi:hypothetical protein
MEKEMENEENEAVLFTMSLVRLAMHIQLKIFQFSKHSLTEHS